MGLPVVCAANMQSVLGLFRECMIPALQSLWSCLHNRLLVEAAFTNVPVVYCHNLCGNWTTCTVTNVVRL